MKKYLIVLLFMSLAGCGGGDSGSSIQSAAPAVQTPVQNTAAITVDGTFGAANRPYTSVTLCKPGTNQCQTIDHIIIDTGSVGLRLISSAAITALGLPSQSARPAGNQLGECYYYATSYAWGSVKLADVKMAGETASNIAVQIVADPGMPSAPTACSNTGGTPQNTAQEMTGNGIIGVGIGPSYYDCGPACASNATIGGYNLYFTCTSSVCQDTTVPITQQVGNPVALFPQDNNGVILQLQSLPNTGTPTAAGQLIFGIGTQADNGLGAAQVYTTDDNGYFPTTYNGIVYKNSFIDSGSLFYTFQDNTLPTCDSGFFCPLSVTSLSAINTGLNGTSGTVNFDVLTPDAFANAVNAVNDVGEAATVALGSNTGFSSSFDWGLSFFFGRSIYVAYKARATPGGKGPYYAYAN